jgi:hypothetical protein
LNAVLRQSPAFESEGTNVSAQIEDVLLGSRHGDGFDHFSWRRKDLRQQRQTAALLTSVAEHLSVEDLLTLIESVRPLLRRTRRPFDAIQIDVN